jgi:ABC-type multidrug transport system fused ATPase/permease subunit
MNSVERIKEYLEIDQEPTDEPMPPAYWPSRDGDIVVEGLTVRYSEELSDVLSDVSFTVRPKVRGARFLALMIC